jgi:hypothetical protein
MQDANGTTHMVEEWVTFLRVQTNDMRWSEPMRAGCRLMLKGKQINPTDDPQVFASDTGERLTRMLASE